MFLYRCITAGLCAVLAIPWAHAALPGDPEIPAPLQATQLASDDAGDGGIEGFGAPAQNLLLDDTRGGDGGIASDTRLAGTVSGNTASHVVTGSNIIQSGSFANASGVPIVIQNSGANVLIQNATVINLQMK
ncbi:MAG: hypothetical protein ACXW2U_16000 [Telluria sp.]